MPKIRKTRALLMKLQITQIQYNLIHNIFSKLDLLGVNYYFQPLIADYFDIAEIIESPVTDNEIRLAATILFFLFKTSAITIATISNQEITINTQLATFARKIYNANYQALYNDFHSLMKKGFLHTSNFANSPIQKIHIAKPKNSLQQNAHPQQFIAEPESSPLLDLPNLMLDLDCNNNNDDMLFEIPTLDNTKLIREQQKNKELSDALENEKKISYNLLLNLNNQLDEAKTKLNEQAKLFELALKNIHEKHLKEIESIKKEVDHHNGQTSLLVNKLILSKDQEIDTLKKKIKSINSKKEIGFTEQKDTSQQPNISNSSSIGPFFDKKGNSAASDPNSLTKNMNTRK